MPGQRAFVRIGSPGLNARFRAMPAILAACPIPHLLPALPTRVQGVLLGHAIFGLIEPHPGHERAWNRYYERDHLLAAGSCAPWTFSTQRWVATRRHKDVRQPRENVIASPFDKGTFLAGMWIHKDRLDRAAGLGRRADADPRGAGADLREARRALDRRATTFSGRRCATWTAFRPSWRSSGAIPGIVLAWVERKPESSLEDSARRARRRDPAPLPREVADRAGPLLHARSRRPPGGRRPPPKSRASAAGS